MKIKIRNKYFKKYLKLKVFLDFNYWKFPEKKYFRLCKKLNKLKALQHKETMLNLGIKEKK